MTIDWDVLWESMKEPLRIVIFAFIGWLLVTIVPQLPPEVGAIVALLLKFIDEYLHQLGKETDNDTLLKGLTRF